MPFKEIKTGKDKWKYKSPTGRVWTKEQVNAYYAKKRKAIKIKPRGNL